MTRDNLNQFQRLKEKHPDRLLLFRCSDYYEAYNQDAMTLVATLGISYTSVIDVPGVKIAGFPHHELDTYLPKLIRAGYIIGICEKA